MLLVHRNLSPHEIYKNLREFHTSTRMRAKTHDVVMNRKAVADLGWWRVLEILDIEVNRSRDV